MRKLLPLLCLLWSAGLIGTYQATAQTGSDFVIANQLMRQQNYEQAAAIFSDLLESNPQSFNIYNRLTECLINLKEYDRAIEISQKQIDRDFSTTLTLNRLAELYHIKGDQEQAHKTWDKALKRPIRSLQSYITIARTLRQRREFERSIAVFEKAREAAGNPAMFRQEISNTHLLAGNYDKAVQEMLELIVENPDRVSYVQRVLLRYNDEFLYDSAILEISDLLDELSADHQSAAELYELELWLLLEKGLYRRALATAKRYEIESSQPLYTLYNLAHKLTSENEFDLAFEAYDYYRNKEDHPLRLRAMHDMAEMMIAWSRHLEQKSLGSRQRQLSLKRDAAQILDEIITLQPRYANITDVVATQIELSLDLYQNPDQADSLLNVLDQQYGASGQPIYAFLEGRTHLFRNEYSRARVAFTRAKKSERIGSLAERASYFLSLTDFYAGDFEFAKIQLKALEKQYTSDFSNDAVELRLWIQDGLKYDSTGSHLRSFSYAIKQFKSGNLAAGFDSLATLATTNRYAPLRDDAVLQVALRSYSGPVELGYQTIAQYLQTNYPTPLKERLLWERARLGTLIVKQTMQEQSGDQHLPAETRARYAFKGGETTLSMPSTPDDLIGLYEELILAFPKGFYANMARTRIRELESDTQS